MEEEKISIEKELKKKYKKGLLSNFLSTITFNVFEKNIEEKEILEKTEQLLNENKNKNYDKFLKFYVNNYENSNSREILNFLINLKKELIGLSLKENVCILIPINVDFRLINYNLFEYRIYKYLNDNGYINELKNISSIFDDETPFINFGIKILGKYYIKNKVQNIEKEYTKKLEKKIPEKYKNLLEKIIFKLKNKFNLNNLDEEKIIELIKKFIMNKGNYLKELKKKFIDFEEKNKNIDINLSSNFNILCLLKADKNSNLKFVPYVNEKNNLTLFHSFNKKNSKDKNNKYFLKSNFENQMVYEISSDLIFDKNKIPNFSLKSFFSNTRFLPIDLSQEKFIEIVNKDLKKKNKQINNEDEFSNSIENLEKIYRLLDSKELFILNNKDKLNKKINILNLNLNRNDEEINLEIMQEPELEISEKNTINLDLI